MSPPFMPLHIGDYRRDTGHLRAAGHGAYLLLIMHYWATGGLPNDDEQLQSIALLNDAEWRKWKPILAAFFEDGWKHPRIDRDLQHAQEAHKRRVEAGQKGGRPQKQSLSNAKAGPKLPITYNQDKKEKEERVRVSRAPRMQQLSDDWMPECPLTPNDLLELDRMRDWAKAKGIRMADWEARWRNWKRKSKEMNGGAKHIPPDKSASAAARRLAEHLDRQAAGGDVVGFPQGRIRQSGEFRAAGGYEPPGILTGGHRVRDGTDDGPSDAA